MDRRTYSRRTCLERCVAIGAAIALAGCTTQTLEDAEETVPWAAGVFDEEEVDLPVTRAFDVVADGIERADDATLEGPDEFEAYLREAEVAVETLEERTEAGETILELEYAAEDVDEEGAARSLGIVAGGYAALVRGGVDADELSASLLDADGRPFGEFEVRTAWAEAYDAGEKSAAVYGGEVVHTLETS